ncbi:MAG TPA: MBOAT family O-acyltransferase [Syntrophales bacterium]|nr:MBOAT family O-acyltransferase [Syntrophales bacterium]
MLFNSFTFILFFVVVFLIYRLPLPWRARKVWLLGASYFFYAAWNPPFVLLLAISTVADWFLARRIASARRPGKKRGFLAASLAVNLGLLGYFKYAGFLIDNLNQLLSFLNVQFSPSPVDVILPVGISFYTFQTLSYTIDIYRGKMKPWHSFLDYALYVSFFPQLVAGPIVRAGDFLPQCERPPDVPRDEVAWGLSLLLLGLFLKIALADGLLAPVAEAVYDGKGVPDFVSAWFGCAAFSGQIYCDFAGYSLCALGLARCFGFAIMENFNCPYAAAGFTDFWRRWHISFSSWLRDYVYFPLGGSRKGWARTQFNTVVTMLIGGLWHGAAWTYVVWGGIHGLLIVVERVLKRVTRPLAWKTGLPVTLSAALFTFALWCFVFVFFRSRTFDQAFMLMGSLAGLPGGGEKTIFLPFADLLITGTVMALLLAAHWFLRDRSLRVVAEKTPGWLRSLLIAGMIVGIAVLSGEDRAFIYFQF